jgi:hypothetical protein
LDTFRRDILKDSTATWTEAIGEENKAAHNGDVVTDASLYETGIRKDQSLMWRVYGLTARQII